MILFLDVISTIPEFSLIDENKIIYSRSIINLNGDKLSDKIIPCFLKINENFDLDSKLNGLIITTGPGSYTSLRVGAAFIAGLQYSKNLSVVSISAETIIKYLINKNNINSAGVYLCSANSQNFFTYQNEKNNFLHQKIDNENFLLPYKFNKIYYNEDALKFISTDVQQIKFSFKDFVINNFNKFDFNISKIITPIYISNNETLNC